jgi:hypothetical protein
MLRPCVRSVAVLAVLTAGLAPECAEAKPLQLKLTSGRTALRLRASNCEIISIPRFGAFASIQASLHAVGDNGETNVQDAGLGLDIQRIRQQLEATEPATPERSIGHAFPVLAVKDGGEGPSQGAVLRLVRVVRGAKGTTITFAVSATEGVSATEYRFVDLSETQYGEVVAFFRDLEKSCTTVTPSPRPARPPAPSPAPPPTPDQQSKCPADPR